MKTLEQQNKNAAWICLGLGLAIIALVTMSGCGTGPTGPSGSPGPQGSSPAAPVSLEGYYVMPNGGYLDVYQDAEGLYTVRQARIVVTNADGSSGLIPIANTAALPLTNSALYSTSSPAYVAVTNNVKQDSNNSVLAAAYLTELIFSKSGNGIQVRVTVNATNGVLFDHTITSQ